VTRPSRNARCPRVAEPPKPVLSAKSAQTTDPSGSGPRDVARQRGIRTGGESGAWARRIWGAKRSASDRP
jgi:hypothetical protein